MQQQIVLMKVVKIVVVVTAILVVGHQASSAQSVVSCPCVPSARYSKSSSPSTLAALSRSPHRYYTSTLSVGTLGEKKYLHNKNNQHYHNHHYHSYNKLNNSDNLLKKSYSPKIGMNSPTELNKIPLPERLRSEERV